MAIATFCRSKSVVDSYSMLTYDSPPEADGQQLINRGTMLSSVVCIQAGSTVLLYCKLVGTKFTCFQFTHGVFSVNKVVGWHPALFR